MSARKAGTARAAGEGGVYEPVGNDGCRIRLGARAAQSLAANPTPPPPPRRTRNVSEADRPLERRCPKVNCLRIQFTQDTSEWAEKQRRRRRQRGPAAVAAAGLALRPDLCPYSQQPRHTTSRPPWAPPGGSTAPAASALCRAPATPWLLLVGNAAGPARRCYYLYDPLISERALRACAARSCLPEGFGGG